MKHSPGTVRPSYASSLASSLLVSYGCALLRLRFASYGCALLRLRFASCGCALSRLRFASCGCALSRLSFAAEHHKHEAEERKCRQTAEDPDGSYNDDAVFTGRWIVVVA